MMHRYSDWIIIFLLMAIWGCSPAPGISVIERTPRTIVYYEKQIPEGQEEQENTESYEYTGEHPFRNAEENPVSTFSIDVDVASYSNVRRHLTSGKMPPRGAVRIEELINYFEYDYPGPEQSVPFSVTTELSTAPWKPSHQLAMIGVQGRRLSTEHLPPGNFVFLFDVSGSMNAPDKLPLLKSAFNLLVEQLREEDTVSIVTYAGAAGLALPPTSGVDRNRILHAIEQLNAGGSTAGGQGINLAYKIAGEQFRPDGNNRVILATDGDFNVGISSDTELVELIEQKRESGIYLTVLGFGTGNYKDSKMEKLADYGNGNYAYIDNVAEARKVLVHELGSTLVTIAKDVKIQVDFNPMYVKSYRLIGYENRMLATKDFDDDTKDAGELGAGHSVTALYEIIPTEYGNSASTTPLDSDGIMSIRLRYKESDADKSKLIMVSSPNTHQQFAYASDDFRFAAAVAEFGMLLRDSEYRGNASYSQVTSIARDARGPDLYGYRQGFIELAETCIKLAER